MVDLPTPPLPDATAMMFFTPEISFTPRWTECDVIFCVMLTVTRGAPGSLAMSSAISFLRISCWVFAGYASWMSTTMSPAPTWIFLTALPLTKSLPVLGSISARRRVWMSASVMAIGCSVGKWVCNSGSLRY